MPDELSNNAVDDIPPTPQPTLSVLDAVAVIVGIVVGAGIFKTPSLVAANVGSGVNFLLVWLLGGVVSLIGALCYAELATTYPHAGGEYYYLTRAFGKDIAWLFAWARLSVMQTGSIAIVAFIFGDYASQLLPLGDRSSSIYTAIAITLLTVLNAIGIQLGKWVQNLLTAAKLLGLLFVVLVGLVFVPNHVSEIPAVVNSQGGYSLAMIFVLLTYGGWSEAAYLSAELHQVQRNMTRTLVLAISVITGIFLLVNFAYLKGLGLTAISQSDAVAADLLHLALAKQGRQFISLLVAISALGSMNGTIWTGARTNYAWGQDFPVFRFLGHWHPKTHTPTNALFVQGAIALALVCLGTLTRSGFTTMVEYTAPVFWLFLLLTVLSLFVLRKKEPLMLRPFQVPLYPLTPFLFCAICVYMLFASLMYTGIGAMVGVVVLLAGLLILLVVRH
ncbi:MAG: amino acid permease [Nostocaceae cyanobacterium]|nr:amino acid permease [Nostocaceae cyanobacterium]